MAGQDQQGPVPSLPDFRGGDRAAERAGTARRPQADGPTGPGADSTTRKGPGLGLILGCGGTALVLLVIAAVIVSLTLTRGGEPGDPISGPDSPGASDPERPREEYIPTEESDDDLAPDDGPTMTVAPSTECSVHAIGTDQEQPDGEIRGGGLSTTLPEGWDPYGSGGQPMMQDSMSAWNPIRGGWYATVTVGRMAYTEADGPAPDLKTMARHLFECDITQDHSIELLGEEPTVTGLTEEETTVDGVTARRLQADVAIEESAGLAPSTHLRYVVIVVDTPGGPSGLVVGAVTDLEDQLADQSTIADGIEVTQ